MPPDDQEEGFNMKESRLKNPSGWIELTRYETVRLLIDALIEAPPGYRFNKTELERRTGLSREAIREHLPRLVELGIVNELDTGAWPEYELNDEGKVTKELFELNSAVNSVLSGEPKEVQQTPTPRVTLADFVEKDQGERVQWLPRFEGIDNSRRDRQDNLVDEPPAGTRFVNAD